MYRCAHPLSSAHPPPEPAAPAAREPLSRPAHLLDDSFLPTNPAVPRAGIRRDSENYEFVWRKIPGTPYCGLVERHPSPLFTGSSSPGLISPSRRACYRPGILSAFLWILVPFLQTHFTSTFLSLCDCQSLPVSSPLPSTKTQHTHFSDLPATPTPRSSETLSRGSQGAQLHRAPEAGPIQSSRGLLLERPLRTNFPSPTRPGPAPHPRAAEG